ncbi:MAG: iron complex outermembrane receptor protein [Oceanicoccus sp.]|jgi:iron complex outermembrane receptor protein
MAYRAVKASLFIMCIAPLTWANDMLDGVTFAAMDGMFFGQEMEMPEVLTAARLRQSQLDTPASVTVIEADTIAALGFKDIEEIFRLVPGMFVGYHSNYGEKTPSVSYHGTNLPEHRRLQVLIDGRSVFKPGLARVDWVDIPIAVEDIARIEVIRGPNSAAYGANSYLGTINILTKHPQDEKAITLKVTAGNRDVQNSYVNVASELNGTGIRWTIGSKQKSGFDFLDNGEDNRDSIEGVYTSLRTYTQLTSSLNMQWQAGYKSGTNQQKDEIDLIDYVTPEDIDAEDYFIWSKFTKDISSSQSAHIQVYSEKFIRETQWQACLAGSQNCGDLNKDMIETKSEIEYQHTSIWSDQLRTVMGARVRLDEFDSETYNQGYSKNQNNSAFTNVEYRAMPNILLNLGGMYEEDELNGDEFSPRVALNWLVSDIDTIRFVYSEAIRSPDLYEKEGNTIYTFKNFTVSGVPTDDLNYPLGEATGLLNSEKIYSHEISYFGLYPSISGQLDIKLFYDKLTGLISETLDDPSLLTNTVQLIQSGVEGQFKVKVNAKNDFMISFAYLDVDDDFSSNKDASGELTSAAERESSLSADTSGSIAWMTRFDNQTRFASAIYHVNNWNIYTSDEGYEFTRLDLNASKDFMLSSGHTVTLQSALQYRLDNDPLVRDKNNYDDDYLIYVSGQLKF